MSDHHPNQFQARVMTPIGGRHHSRSRSRSEERHRRRDSQRLERKLDDLTDRLENIDLVNKVEDWNRGSSSEGSYRDRDDVWSADSRGWSTPPSSPGLSAVMVDGPSGSLGRRGSKGYHPRRDSGYVGNAYPRDRDYGRRSAGQVVIEPHNSHSHRRIDYGHSRRRSDAQGLGLRYPNSPNGGSSPRRHGGGSRPLLHHGNTWSGRDDYPKEPYAERERLPRAITQFPGEDWGVADVRRGAGGRVRDGERRGGGYYDERRGSGGGGRRERAYY